MNHNTYSGGASEDLGGQLFEMGNAFMNLEISLCSLDNLHLREDWESENALLSFSHSPHSVHLSFSFWFSVSLSHTLTQTHSDFHYISLSIRSTPSPITMTLVLPTYFLSILSLSLSLPPAGFISGPAQCPTVMS